MKNMHIFCLRIAAIAAALFSCSLAFAQATDNSLAYNTRKAEPRDPRAETSVPRAEADLAGDPKQIGAEEMPQRWMYAEGYQQTLPTDDDWWRRFGDATLDSLIALGVDRNYDVLQAQRRIAMARAALAQARSAYYPQLSLSGGWNRARNSGMLGPKPGDATTASYFDLGLDMSWEIDVFGKVAARARESKAAYAATSAEYDATMVSLAAKIASTYFQLRCVQAEIALMDRHIASQARVLEITQARFEAGIASKLDVAQATTTYNSTLASVQSLYSQQTAAINTLAVLVGEFPQNISENLSQPAQMPDYHQLVAVGVPMEMLRRRPDVVEAEATLAQYAAAVGVAKKDFLPTLSLNGSIGTQAHRIGDMFGKKSIAYTVAPTLSWTVFSGFSRKAAVESAKAQMMAGIDNYNLTLLTAVQEVETAMSAYTNDLAYIDYLDKVVASSHEAFELSIDLYKQGLTDFINVTNSQITLLQYANQAIVARGQALADLVSLYQALGGGY